MRLPALLLLASLAAAADPIGAWRFGSGTVDGAPAAIGTIVLTGQEVVSATDAPMRLEITEAPGITVILAAGSTGRFQIERAGADRNLVLDLATGAVQVDVTDRGPFASIHVRGAAMDVRVTGTLFVVERTRAQADYVALVRGKVKVGLKPDVARAIGKGGEIELGEHQGLAADIATGLGAVTALSGRPQITGSAASRVAAVDQAMGSLGTAWSVDLAAQFTAGGGIEDALGGGGAAGAGPSLFLSLAEDLGTSLGDLGQPPTSTTDETVSRAAATGPAAVVPLAAPPSPPSPVGP